MLSSISNFFFLVQFTDDVLLVVLDCYLLYRQHRYRSRNADKLQRNLGPPTNVLHICNIPETYTHMEIKDMFIERGFTVKESKECNGNPQMCYLIFAG